MIDTPPLPVYLIICIYSIYIHMYCVSAILVIETIYNNTLCRSICTFLISTYLLFSKLKRSIIFETITYKVLQLAIHRKC